MRKISSLRHEVKQNNKKIFNTASNKIKDKLQHGYKVNPQSMRLMHYRFVEKNLSNIMEAAEEQKALSIKNAAARKEACLTRFKCVCGKGKMPPFPTCRDCHMKNKARMD